MLHILLTYAYPVMIPLALIEGPIVCLAAGVGATTGRINPLVAYLIVMVGALFQDAVYYWLGRWAMSSEKARSFAQRTRLISKTLGPLEDAWRQKMFVTLVASKFAYGLYAPIIVSAGMAKAPFRRFLAESLALSAVVLAGWLAAGYGLARAYGSLGRDAHWIMLGLGVLGVAGLVVIARYTRRHLGGNGRPDKADDRAPKYAEASHP